MKSSHAYNRICCSSYINLSQFLCVEHKHNLRLIRDRDSAGNSCCCRFWCCWCMQHQLSRCHLSLSIMTFCCCFVTCATWLWHHTQPRLLLLLLLLLGPFDVVRVLAIELLQPQLLLISAGNQSKLSARCQLSVFSIEMRPKHPPFSLSLQQLLRHTWRMSNSAPFCGYRNYLRMTPGIRKRCGICLCLYTPRLIIIKLSALKQIAATLELFMTKLTKAISIAGRLAG